MINGSDTNFSHPFVLTYPSNGYPTDIPRPQLMSSNLTGFSQDRPDRGYHSTPSCGALTSASSARKFWSQP